MALAINLCAYPVNCEINIITNLLSYFYPVLFAYYIHNLLYRFALLTGTVYTYHDFNLDLFHCFIFSITSNHIFYCWYHP